MPPLIDVKETFKVAVDNGNRVIEIELGEHDVDDRIAEIAVNQLQVATLSQSSDADADADADKQEGAWLLDNGERIVEVGSNSELTGYLVNNSEIAADIVIDVEPKPKSRRGRGAKDAAVSNEGTSQT